MKLLEGINIRVPGMAFGNTKVRVSHIATIVRRDRVPMLGARRAENLEG